MQTQLKKILPQEIYGALCRVGFDKLYEIRLIADKPVRVLFGGKYYYIDSGGIAGREGLRVNARQIAEVVLKSAEYSIYAYNERITEGFITLPHGVRIGIVGDAVYDNSDVKTQKNFNALVIRVPHEVRGCADKAFRALMDSDNKNMLIVSPPACGKTTLLRDLSRLIAERENVLVADERGELAAVSGGTARLDVGKNAAVISFAQKKYAFMLAVRGMRPDYIITDELGGEEDLRSVANAACCGVNVIASAHASGIEALKRRGFSAAIENRIFGRYIVLSCSRGIGTYEKIYDEELNAL